MKFKEALEQSAQGGQEISSFLDCFQKKKMSHLEQFAHLLSMFTNEKERNQKDAGEFKPLRAICSRCVKKSHQNFSDFQTFVIHY